MSGQAYVAHIIAQTRQNVAFLVEQNHISQADADVIMARLPAAESPRQGMPMPAAHNTPVAPVFYPQRHVPRPPVRSTTVQARALWAYAGGDADDLSFSANDVIEITEETNADWWKGRIGNKEGLFPSNYVEKIFTPAPSGEKAAYKPFGPALHGTDLPPSAPPGEVQTVNSVGLQETPGQEQKKNKFGKFGNTMAHSAVGGVGFGAGAAIGGGLVRAIF